MKTASYRLAAKRRLTETVTELTLEPISATRIIQPLPGQYAAIRFSRGPRITPARCFSITNAPDSDGMLQFAMRSTGPFTRTAAELRIGDRVEVQGPYGQFVLEPHDTRPVVMLAGGIGVTPFVSMIKGLAAKQSPRRVHLLYSQTSETDVPFAAELVRLERAAANLKTTFVITNGHVERFAEVRYHLGYMSGALLDSVAGDYASTRFYVCGSKPFMRSTMNLLRNQGVLEHQIHSEAFAQGARQSETGTRLIRRVYTATASSVLAITAIVGGGNLLHTATEVDAQSAALAARSPLAASPPPAAQAPKPTTSATPLATPAPAVAPTETTETPASTPQATAAPTTVPSTPAQAVDPSQTTQQPISQVS